jgi:hypothetical protein
MILIGLLEYFADRTESARIAKEPTYVSVVPGSHQWSATIEARFRDQRSAVV